MRAFYEKVLTAAGCGRLQGAEVLGGGIHRATRLSTSAAAYFLKWSTRAGAFDMFCAEVDGLDRLRRAGLRTPEVIDKGSYEEKAYLLLEYVSPQPATPRYWDTLAHQLAHLHEQTATHFGLEADNFIGALPQKNAQTANWTTFFVEQRLRSLTSSPPLSLSVVEDMERLCFRLPQLLPTERPALLHGDLWSGNLHIGEKGQPSWIDPAVYYGAKEIELALPMLFGGFSSRFFEVYETAAALEPGWKERVQIYLIYPLLVHVHLFGQQYLSSLNQQIKRFL